MRNIHKGLVLCNMLAVLFGVGCGGAVDDPSGGEPLMAEEPVAEETPGEVRAFCSWGYYTCPSDGAVFEYDTPGCGPIYKPRAQSLCEAHCPVTCKDSGWFSDPY